MKFLPFYRIAIAAVLTVIALPSLAAAENKSIDKPVKYYFAESIPPLFQDSIPVRKKADKAPEQVEKPRQDAQDERIGEAGGRAIKQVPRSIPKLKPQPVTDRIKIRRPPMKIPKKGLGGYRF